MIFPAILRLIQIIKRNVEKLESIQKICKTEVRVEIPALQCLTYLAMKRLLKISRENKALSVSG